MSFYGNYHRRESRFQKYDKVKVVGGRKVPIGVEGEIFWISNPMVFSKSRFANIEFKVGIKDAQGNVYWTYERNVKLTEREGKPAQHDGLYNVIWPQSASLQDRGDL